MRLDKYLKVSRILKRRTVAADACKGGKVEVNNKEAKPSVQLKINDIVSITFASGKLAFQVLSVDPPRKKEDLMYVLIENKE